MSSVMVPRKSKEGWIIDLAPDFAEALGVPEGSMAILYASDGKISTEIIPPPSPALEKSIQRISEKYKEAFEEMRKFGD